jgi:hypothetical protein
MTGIFETEEKPAREREILFGPAKNEASRNMVSLLVRTLAVTLSPMSWR